MAIKKQKIVFDINNEQAILSSMMKSKAIRRKLSAELSEFHFIGKRHRNIFKVLRTMVDIEYNEDTFLALSEGYECGGYEYIRDVESCFDIQKSNIEVHTKKLIKDSVKHRFKSKFIPELTEVIENPQSDLEEIQDVLSKADKKVRNSFTDNIVMDTKTVKQKYLSELKQRSMGLKSVVGFGFSEIDENLVEGMQPGKVIVVTARPSMGKTTVVSNIIRHLITKTDKKVLACPLETGSANLIDYLVVQECYKKGWNITVSDILRNMAKIDIAKKHKINKALDSVLSEESLDVADSRELTLGKLKYILQNGNDDICFIDLFEKLADVTEENLPSKLEEVQKIAQETRTCIVIVSQIKRTGKNVVDKRPDMEMIKNSGKYEEIADIIIGLYREHYYNKEAPDILEIIVMKQRNGLRDYSEGYEFLGHLGTIGEHREIEDGGW